MNKLYYLVFSVFILSNNLFSQTLFQKTYGGTGDDEAKCINKTTDGGYIIGGYTTSFSAGDKDAYIIKTDENGIVEWSKTFGGTLNDEIVHIQQTNDKGYILSGFRNNNTTFFISKIDSVGNMQFTDTMATYSGSKVIQLADGNYLFLNSKGTVPNIELQIVKINTSGALIWQKSFSYAFGGSILEQPNGNIIILSGTGNTLLGANDLLLTKLTSSGTIIWHKVIGKSANDGAYDLKRLSNGNFFISGGSWSNAIGNYDAILLETDSNATIQWSRNYGSANKYYRSLDGYKDIASGYIANISNYQPDSSSDMGLIKVKSTGLLNWAKSYGGSKEENCNSFVIANDHGFVLAGYTKSFGAGNKDIYIVKTDSLGATSCNSATLPLSSANWLGSTATHSVTNTTAVPFFNFISHTDSVYTTDSIACNNVGIFDISADNNSFFQIYPNPSSGNFTIQLNASLQDATIQIYNAMGSIVYQETSSLLETAPISIENLASGYYYIRIANKNHTAIQKIVID